MRVLICCAILLGAPTFARAQAADPVLTASTATTPMAPGPAIELGLRLPGLDLPLTLHPTIEYRVRHQLMSPLSLNDLTAPELAYFDQRLRAGFKLGLGPAVRVVVLADVLDGVVFGDNGSFTGVPRKNRGSVVATRQPNLARLGVGRLSATGGAIDPDNYGLVYVEAPPIELRQAYGEATLPFGLLRAGRMPLGFGRSVLVHDGTRINRWGVSGRGDTVDGVAVGTKLSEIPRALAGQPIDRDLEHGVFAAFLAGQMTTGIGNVVGDGLLQLVGTVWASYEDVELGPLHAERARAGLIYATRGQDKFDTRVHSVTGYVEASAGPWRFLWHHVQMLGGTREVSESLALLSTSSGPPQRQPLEAFGGLAELAFRVAPPLELSFELFYASGDDDPRSNTPITQLTFSEDTNVGLHLVKNVIGYQTARSAALGVENLRALNPPTMAVAEVDTRGALQNAVVLFPQVLVDPLPWLSLRSGVLVAFAAVPVVDPIGTVLRTDGVTNADDKVNYNGGRPAGYWGTEIDFGVTLRPVPHFLLDVEAAYLFPGPALQDENRDAVRSLYVTTRGTFFWD